MGRNATSKKSLSVKTMTIIALMTTVLCVLGPLYIPVFVSPVPVSLTNFVIFLIIYILKMKRAVMAVFLYIVIGMVGLPVFSGFSGGLGKLAGPTGGYLIGFIFMTVIAGFFVDKFYGKKYMEFMGMTIGLLICYLFGSVWLMIQSGISLGQALFIGVVPYVVTDVIKIVAAAFAGPKLRKATVQIMED